jgi:hypothetical protein
MTDEPSSAALSFHHCTVAVEAVAERDGLSYQCFASHAAA